MKNNDNTHRLSVSKMQKKKNSKANNSSFENSNPNEMAMNKVGKPLKSLEEHIEKPHYPYQALPKSENDESEIDLKEYLEIAFHYKWMIVAVFICVLIMTIAYSYTQQSEYKSSTKIFIHEDVMELQVINNKPYFKQSYDLSTWIQIIKSSEITKRVSQKLDNTISSSGIANMIECDTQRDEDHIITVSAKSLDAKIAADVANNVYFALSDYDTEQRMKGYEYSVNYLEMQLAEKRKNQDTVNSSINDFLTQQGIDINTLNLEDNIERVNDLQKQISAAEVELASIEASITKINYDLNREDQSIVNQTVYSEPYKIRLMNLETEKARALTNYTEKHPRIIAIQQNIDNVKKLIEEGMNERIQLKNISANPIRQRLINDLLAKETERVALIQKIVALKNILSEIEISPKFKKILESKFNNKKDLSIQIANLQGQYNNAKLNSNIASSRLYQLQEAEAPSGPSADNLKRNILVGIVLGLGMGIGLALLLNFLNDKIRSVGDYQNRYSIPTIGIIPKSTVSPMQLIKVNINRTDKNKQTNNEEKISGKTDTKLSEEDEQTRVNELRRIESLFEPIVINFKYLMLNKEQKVFAIQSSILKEGKTFLSYYLAKSLANENLNVLLIDTDFFKRTLSIKLKCQHENGLSEVLSEQVELNSVIKHDKGEKIWFLPAGKRPPNILEMYRSKNFKSMLKRLKGIYDIIIIDTPAFFAVPSIVYFLSEVDGTILPIKINYTTHSNLFRLMSKSKLFNINILGVILNYAQVIDRKHYKYEYGYGYGYENQGEKQKGWKKHINKLYNFYLSSKFEEEAEDETIDKTRKSESIFKRIYSNVKGLFVFEDED